MTDGGLALVVDRLRCPVCERALVADASTLRCADGHGFDVARQGYVSLFGSGSRAATGDTAQMVAAREGFLGRAHYAPIAGAVSDAIPVEAEGLCLDLAGGTGYYLARVLDAHPRLVGLDLDLSKFALRRAARAHPRISAVAADAWRPLPVQTAAVAFVLSIFGPRNAVEIGRVLGPDGRLIVVTPTAWHLAELVGRLGLITVDARKQERLGDQLAAFTRLSARTVEYSIELSRADVLNEVLMGPSAYHLDHDRLAEAVDVLPGAFVTTVSVIVSVYAGPEPVASILS